MRNDPIWKRILKEGLSKIFANILALSIPLVIAYSTGIWTRDFAGRPLDAKDIVIGVACLIFFLLIFLGLNYLLKLPWFRYHTGRMNPFEGVWKETYSMTYPLGGATNYVSIFSIRSGPVKDLQITGVVFATPTGAPFSRFSGKVVDVGKEGRHLKYIYEVRFLQGKRQSAEGFGFYDVDFTGVENEPPVAASGGFVELLRSTVADPNSPTVLEPHQDTSLRRVPFKEVKRKISKYYPVADEDYQKLL